MKGKKAQPPGSRIFKCNICDRGFKHRSSMATHRRTHTGETPYECPVCHKKFGYNSSCMEHVKKVHKINEKPKDGVAYSCNSCTRLFRTQVALKCHKHYQSIPGHKLHTVPFPTPPPASQYQKRAQFNCPKCPFKSNFSASMRCHMKTHNVDFSSVPDSAFRRTHSDSSQSSKKTQSGAGPSPTKTQSGASPSSNKTQSDTIQSSNTSNSDTRRLSNTSKSGTSQSSNKTQSGTSQSLNKTQSGTSQSSNTSKSDANHKTSPGRDKDRSYKIFEFDSEDGTKTKQHSDVTTNSNAQSQKKGAKSRQTDISSTGKEQQPDKLAPKQHHSTPACTSSDSHSTKETPVNNITDRIPATGQDKEVPNLQISTIEATQKQKPETIPRTDVSGTNVYASISKDKRKVAETDPQQTIKATQKQKPDSTPGSNVSETNVNLSIGKGKRKTAAKDPYRTTKRSKPDADKNDATSKQCSKCKKVYKSNLHLRYHTIFCQSVQHKRFRCPICNKVHKYKWMLNRHMLDFHKDKVEESEVGVTGPMCKICKRVVKDNYVLMMHMRTHSEERPFHCSKCSASFKHGHNLRKHIAIHEKASALENMRECTECGVTFPKSYLLFLHQRTVHKKTPAIEVNSSESKYSSDVNENQAANTDDASSDEDNVIHSNSDILKNSGKGPEIEPLSDTLLPSQPGPYVCDICGLTFSKRSHVTNHISIHLNDPRKAVTDQSIKQKETLGQMADKESPPANSNHIRKKNKDTRNMKKTQPSETVVPQKLSYEAEIYDRYLDLGPDDRKSLHNQINHLFCLSKDVLESSQIEPDTSLKSHKFECQVCFTKFTIKENLHRHVRNRPFEHAPYFKRRLGPLKSGRTKHSSPLGKPDAVEKRNLNTQKLGTPGLKAMKEFINMVLNKISLSKVIVPVPTTKQTQELSTSHQVIGNTSLHQNSQLSGPFMKQYYCDICACPYTRRYNMLLHRRKHTDEEFQAAGVTREIEGLYSFSTRPDDIPPGRKKRRYKRIAGKRKADVEVDAAKSVAEPVAVSATSGYVEEGVEIYMDTDYAEVDTASEEIASEEVTNDAVAKGNNETHEENANVDQLEPENDEDESLETKTEDEVPQNSAADAPVSKDNTACPLCEMLFLEKQKTITCHLCCFRFCMECSKVPRELHAQIMESDANISTGYMWMCNVCRPLLPRLALVMNQLGDLEHYLNNRISDLEKKVGGVQKIYENSQKYKNTVN